MSPLTAGPVGHARLNASGHEAVPPEPVSSDGPGDVAEPGLAARPFRRILGRPPVFRPWVALTAIALLGVIAGPSPAGAQPMPSVDTGPAVSQGMDFSGFGVRWGYNDRYQRFGLSYETRPWWVYNTESWGQVTASTEVLAAGWRASGGRDPGSLWQLGVTPILRWWPTEYVYGEIGVGANVFSRTTFADRGLGSAFQFGSHIGVGMLLNERHRLGLRYIHYSNADIKSPNQGLDVFELTYTLRF